MLKVAQPRRPLHAGMVPIALSLLTAACGPATPPSPAPAGPTEAAELAGATEPTRIAQPDAAPADPVASPGLAARPPAVQTATVQLHTPRSIRIMASMYQPRDIIVPQTMMLIWTNADEGPHTVTADDRSFDSGLLAPGGSFSQTFTRVGKHGYHCQLHGAPGSGLFGTVVVGGF